MEVRSWKDSRKESQVKKCPWSLEAGRSKKRFFPRISERASLC